MISASNTPTWPGPWTASSSSSPPSPAPSLRAGMKVVVTQQIPQRDEVWTTTARGTVVKLEQVKTGSWFAHSKDDKLWLDRLTLRIDDGEIVELILDHYTKIEVVN